MSLARSDRQTDRQTDRRGGGTLLYIYRWCKLKLINVFYKFEFLNKLFSNKAIKISNYYYKLMKTISRLNNLKNFINLYIKKVTAAADAAAAVSEISRHSHFLSSQREM